MFEEVAPTGEVMFTDASVFVEELAGATKHDDQMDAASYAIIELNGGSVSEPAAPEGGDIDTAPTPARSDDPEAAVWDALSGGDGWG